MSLCKTREGETGADTWRESPFDGGARDCSDAAAGQGVPRIAVSPQEPEEASKGLFESLPRECGPSDTLILDLRFLEP